MISRIAHLMVVLLVFMAVSCNKVLNVVSVTAIDASTLFSDERSATTAVIGIYQEMQKTQSIFNGYSVRYTGLYAGELYKTSASNQTDNSFAENDLRPTDAIISEFWNPAYFYIYSANQAMENLTASSSITQEVKNRLKGELLFIRGMVYFQMVNLFGDIPLVLQVNPDSTSTLKRAPKSDIYNQIIRDLLTAYDLLSIHYPTPTLNLPSDRIRANKAAAAALLAKVYLFAGDFINAEKYSSWVINSNTYKLEENLDNVFLAASSETILGLYPTNIRYNTAEARIFLVNPTKPAFSLTGHVIEKLGAGDLRYKHWIKIVGPAYVPFKYKEYDTNQVLEYTVLLRYAEMFLIRAEANWNLGKLTEAVNDINMIRNRAKADKLINPTKEQLRQWLEDEYLREFFTENANRWFQISRLPALNGLSLKRADEILSALRPGKWNGFKIYWPIPKEEILKSKFLVQNPGYPN